MNMNVAQLAASARARNPLVALEDSKQITQEGKDWLTAAVDPFHDFEISQLRGFPDMATEPTVVIRIQQALDVSAPSDCVTGGMNWDCHIALSPIDWIGVNQPLPGRSGPGSQGGPPGYVAAAQSYPRGAPGISGAGYLQAIPSGSPYSYLPTARVDGLMVNSVVSNSALGSNMTFTPLHYPAGDTGLYKGEGLYLDEFMDFQEADLPVYRILYSGFEVVNTTSSLFAQGAVTIYEYGHSYEQSGSLGYSNVTQQTQYFRSPPNELSTAKAMPGAQTWEAKKGCYNVAKFQTDNPFTAAGNTFYVIQQNKEQADSGSGYASTIATPTTHTMGSFISPGIGVADYALQPIDAASFTCNHFSRMTTTGAYFTGLSPQSTLTVTWRVAIERLPSANKPFMLSLAAPSASYDPDALALYSLICTRLPPGVPQNYNDAGKWFSMITDVAKEVLPHAFPLVGAAQMMLNHLGRPALAAGIGAAANAAANNSKKQNRPQSARKPNPKPSTPNFGAGKGNKGRRR